MPGAPATLPAPDTLRRRLVGAVLALALALVGLQAAAAPPALAADPVSYVGPAFPASGPAPTEDKPQSKLWYADGSWWALMRASAGGITVHELQADHTWRNTGTVVDDRPTSSGDALWEGGKLYVASRTAAGDVEVIRLSYDTASDTYAVDAGFPTRVTSGGSESVTIARDSRSRLWITYTQGSRVYVARTTTSDSTWTAPFLVPDSDTSVAADDLSAVIAFSGRIGVMWSDQASNAVRFAVHEDGAADDVWTQETALSGARYADDHINIKSLLETDDGRIYAAVKTSLGDASTDAPTDPSIAVLTRAPGATTGPWAATTAATVADVLTRPQLALDATNREVYVVMSTESGGSVYYKKSPLGTLSFPTGKGTTLISRSGARINNASTAKAPVTAGTGLVVLASDNQSTNRYYHAELALDGGGPVADTTAPSVPGPVTATPASPTSVALSWPASTDAVGVASYRVTRGTTVVAAAVTGTAFTDTGLTASTGYSYTVSAVDAAGNRSAESAPATATTPAAPTTTRTPIAVNTGGGAVTIDGQAWASQSAAGLTTNGSSFTAPTSLALNPATTPERTTMIKDALYRSSGLTLSIPRVPNGTWDVFVTGFEDNTPVTYDLTLEGTRVITGATSGPAGTWKRQGPFPVTITDGKLDLSTARGAYNISGIELTPTG